MGSVTEKLTDRKSPSAPHSFENGVEGKVCGGARAQTRKNSTNCFKWCALDEYPLNYAYQDGHSGTCKQCKKDSRGVYVPPDQTQPPVEVKSLALRPIREYSDAPFCDSTVKAVALLEDGTTKHYLGLRAMCDVLGVDDKGQRERIERNEVLTMGLRVCVIPTPQGQQDHYVLDAALVPFWLATMDASRLKDEVRPKVVHFQRIAADVLARYFMADNDVPPAPQLPPAPPLESMEPFRPLLDVFTNTGTQAQQLSRHFQDMDRLMQAIPAHYEALVKYAEQLAPLAKAVGSRRNPLTHGWIYVLRDMLRKRCKIGMTQDSVAENRQRSVEGQWGKGQSERAIWIETDNIKLEKLIQKFYKGRKHTHLEDEWYRLSDDDVACLEALGPFLRCADFRDEMLMREIVIQGDLF